MVPYVQDFPTLEELAHHAPDKLSLIVRGSRRVFTILNISLDIMVPWLGSTSASTFMHSSIFIQ